MYFIIKKKLGNKFIRINPGKKDFDIFVEIGKTYNHFTENIVNKRVQINIIPCKNGKRKKRSLLFSM